MCIALLFSPKIQFCLPRYGPTSFLRMFSLLLKDLNFLLLFNKITMGTYYGSPS